MKNIAQSHSSKKEESFQEKEAKKRAVFYPFGFYRRDGDLRPRGLTRIQNVREQKKRARERMSSPKRKEPKDGKIKLQNRVFVLFSRKRHIVIGACVIIRLHAVLIPSRG